jgi:hypothetical protein
MMTATKTDRDHDIDARMAALTWEQWLPLLDAEKYGDGRVANAPGNRALVARLREKLDGLDSYARRQLEAIGKGQRLRMTMGMAALRSAWLIYPGGTELTPQGRAALHLLGEASDE